MSLSIRRANLEDAAVVAEFNRNLAWETEAKTLDEAVVLRGVRRCLADAARGLYFLAEEHGQVLGQAMITWEWSDWRDGWFWWLQSVYVRMDARQRGIFGLLFRHIRELAKGKQDVLGIRLYVEGQNTPAQGVYAKLGFQRTGYHVLEATLGG